jgi:hypothetical protein
VYFISNRRPKISTKYERQLIEDVEAPKPENGIWIDDQYLDRICDPDDEEYIINGIDVDPDIDRNVWENFIPSPDDT